MKIELLIFLFLIISSIQGRVTSIKSMREHPGNFNTRQPRKLGKTLSEDLRIGPEENNLFTQYLRYHMQLANDEKHSHKLSGLIHQLLEKIDDFSIQVDDGISLIYNDLGIQRLKGFIKKSNGNPSVD